MNNDLEKMIEMMPMGVYIVNKNNKIIGWNKDAEIIFGLKKNEVIGRDINFIKIFENNFEKKQLDHITCLKKNNKMQNIVYIKNSKNIYKQVYIRAVVFPEYRDDIWSIISVCDLSDIRQCDLYIDNKEEKFSFHKIIGKDKKMVEIFKMIELASDSLANILVYGESGTGKELIAKAIHDLSERKDEPFITVNCSALSETLLESELFGHVKGAFTGAYKDKIGKFEASHGGTIFLDEIGDISPLIQLKLLRVIQEKIIMRVGDNREIKVDMRIITATNKNLRKLVGEGKFREDLFYRLKVFPIHSVPLRDRKNDIPLLIDHFIKKFNMETGKNIIGLTPDASRLFMDYCWPGNVRELENCIEHGFVVCNNEYIDIFDLPQELRIVSIRQGICNEPDNLELEDREENDISTKKNNKRIEISKEKLINLLNKNKWNKQKTADELGISRVALWKKIKKFEIE